MSAEWDEFADDDVKIAWYDNRLAEQKQATAEAVRRAEAAERMLHVVLCELPTVQEYSALQAVEKAARKWRYAERWPEYVAGVNEVADALGALDTARNSTPAQQGDKGP